MKKIILAVVALLFLFPSCKDFEFANPWDPDLVLRTPSNFIVENYTDSTLTISWKNNSQNEFEFILEGKTDGTAYSVIREIPRHANRFTLPFVWKISTQYTFRIKAVNKVTESGYSNEATNKVLNWSVANFRILEYDSKQITLGWSDTISIPHTLTVKGGESPTALTPITTLQTNSDSTTIPLIAESGKKYYYQVVCNTANVAMPSTIVSLGEASGMFIGGGNAFRDANSALAGIANVSNNQWQYMTNASYGLAGTVFENKPYITGYFTFYNGNYHTRVTYMNRGGWVMMDILDDSVACLKAYHGELYAGGVFSATIKGNSVPHMVKASGTSWLPCGTGMDGKVYCLETFQDYLIAGGTFTTAGGSGANSIARWNGASWQPMSSGFNGTVRALLVYNNELYAAGQFTASGSTPLSGIAKWNGSGWVSAGMSCTGMVYTLAAFQGALYAGGSFTLSGDSTPTNFAKWNGTVWTSIPSVTGAVYCLSPQNNLLIVGGKMVVQSGSVLTANLATYDGFQWGYFTPSSGSVNSSGSVLTILPYTVWKAL